jgi:hypothetical protein
MKAAQLPVLSSRIMALTRGTPYREREFREHYNDMPNENARSTLGTQPQVHDPVLRDKKRAKQARRRERQATKADQA